MTGVQTCALPIFSIDVYGNVTVENVDSTAVSDNGYPLIVMVDDTTKVRISKRDITTGEELPGATLQIIDENGNVVEEWVSTNEPHMIEGKLIAGKEYTLKEIIAPEGYEITNEIKFTVNADGTVTEVVMYDEIGRAHVLNSSHPSSSRMPSSA